jgi:FAD/FMN-containing dehydrogenase
VSRGDARRVPAAQTWLFGHAADGNVHVNVTGVDPATSASTSGLQYTASLGGSISAEHGIEARQSQVAASQPQRRRARGVPRSSAPSTPRDPEPGVLFPSSS